jgi:hypothetical protein
MTIWSFRSFRKLRIIVYTALYTAIRSWTPPGGKMSRTTLLTVRVNGDERRQIAELAERLERNQSDTVRLALRSLARQLDAQPEPPTPPQVARKAA